MANDIPNLDLIDKVMQIEREFDKALEHDQKNRARSERNWGMYSGFDYGQWQKEAVSELRNQNRHVAQYNFIRGKIDGLAGSITKNWYDIDFVPVDGQVSELTRTLKGMFYADKELLDWDHEYLECIRDGLIYRGVEQMIISDRYNPVGNIGFERIMPGHIILDPWWKSNNTWDLKRAWKVAYLTPKEIMNKYNSKAERIKERVEYMALRGYDYKDDEESPTVPYFNLQNIYGSKYRVIEYHHMENVPRTIEYVITPDGFENIALPGGYEENISFIQRNAIDLTRGTIKRRVSTYEYWVTTSCSDLDDTNFLEDRKSEIQIGRLPFFPFSAARINGVDSGIVDLLIDTQQTINKRESLSDHIISSSAHGGHLVDPAVVDDTNKMKALKENWHKPNALIETKHGALRSGRSFVQEIPKSQYHGEIYQELTRMSGYMDMISKQTATLEGRSESSHDTGILFARRQLQSEINQATLMKGVEQHWNDKGEAYMLLAQYLYTGTYREFNTNFGKGEKKEQISVNTPRYDEKGVSLENNIRSLPRHKVVVSQSPSGVTVQATERAINAELLNRIPGENYLSRAIITKNIMRTLNLSDEDRQIYEQSSDLEVQNAYLRINADNAQLQAVISQVQQQQMAQQAMMEQQQAGVQPQQQNQEAV